MRETAANLARVTGAEEQLRRVRDLTSRERWRNRRDEERLDLLLRLALPRDANCVDVGANVGDILARIQSTADQGRHVAFEPLPELAADLRRRFPSVEVHEAAVAETPGQRSFTRMVGDEARSGFGVHAWEAGPSRTFEVRVVTLDDTLGAAYVPSLIKIDVEGAELQVLRGGRETLRRHQPMIALEHGGGPHTAAVHALLTSEFALRLFDLDGEGPMDLHTFTHVVKAGKRWNFLARR